MDMMARRRALMAAGHADKTIRLLASGTYEKTDFSSVNSRLDIPVSFSGTPVQILVYAPDPVSAGQTYKWARQFELSDEIKLNLGFQLAVCVYRTATGNPVAQAGSVVLLNNNTLLRCSQQSSSYHVQNNTYRWYIWGWPD